jgi:azurin
VPEISGASITRRPLSYKASSPSTPSKSPTPKPEEPEIGTMAISTYVHAAIAAAVLATFSSVAAAKTCQLEIDSTDQMTYNKKELVVESDCTEVTLTLTHSGKLPVTAMGHNWVLTETKDMQAVATAGMSAGAANNYVKEGPEVIAHTKLIGGGEKTSVTFPTSKLKKGGDYSFFCSFPGHWSVMKGKLIYK